MANDTDMWKDIEALQMEGRDIEAHALITCFEARYVDGDLNAAEKLKRKFRQKYGYWTNWY